jgi:hypothetical protein
MTDNQDYVNSCAAVATLFIPDLARAPSLTTKTSHTR